jgi:SPP1 family predicted phage head-tail adaptor
MSLDAGKLRHRLIILEPDQGQDSDTGDMETVWSELCTVWGSFEPYSTKEFIAAASNQNQTSVRAVIRYRSDVAAGMRVSFRSKLYEIVGPPLPDKDSGLEYLTLMLAEAVLEEAESE